MVHRHGHRHGMGVRVTWTSTLFLLALLLSCCGISAAIATVMAQKDPTWTGAHTAVGLLCSCSTLLFAALAAGVAFYRLRRGSAPPPEAGS